MLKKINRRSIRIKNYDYAQTGAYFVTICTQYKKCIFGEVRNREMCLNEIGEMIDKWWVKLQMNFCNIWLDEYVIMPNHFHGIIYIPPPVGADPCVCPSIEGEHMGSPLPKIIQWFKTMTTNNYLQNVKMNHWPRFENRLWQRNYYEHVIRDENNLNRIREYIIYNPDQWDWDQENPNCIL